MFRIGAPSVTILRRRDVWLARLGPRQEISVVSRNVDHVLIAQAAANGVITALTRAPDLKSTSSL